MDEKEVKDTIFVAWPPRPKPDNNETARFSNTQASASLPATSSTSAATRSQLKAKRAPARVCGFCKPYLGADGVCHHRNRSYHFVHLGGRSVARVHKPIKGRGSKQKAVAAATEEDSKSMTETL
ncbi:hypothetical protein N8I77_008731 [Diaporthe amygdali]|uniref:Uncharacterized protein n=1 Tax=Phomopsis amygdali TaxID=1214568 RepID=A0AAD9W015_PHOAM|nr:hypothetical protein N8I77_008731 [Diaporthe amygdali]